MTRINRIINFVLILKDYFNNCRYSCFLVIWNEVKLIPKKLRGINSIGIFDPWDEYYLNEGLTQWYLFKIGMEFL